jgi:hypothetical protein
MKKVLMPRAPKIPDSTHPFFRIERREMPLCLARVLGLGMVALTPWFYGGTTPEAIHVLSFALLGLSMLALAGWLAVGRLPRSIWVMPVALLLLVVGWAAALHPVATFDEVTKLLFVTDTSPGLWPSTVDASRSVPVMLRLTGLVGLLALLYDMAVRESWRRRLAVVLALSGVGVAVHGLTQRLEGDFWNYWQGRNLPTTVFAGFWYHGNAASFLNLTWPFVVAAAMKTFVTEGRHAARAFWVLASMLMWTAVWVNVSKAGHVLLLVQSVLFFALVLPGFLRRKMALGQQSRTFLMALFLVVVGALGFALLFGTDNAFERWGQFGWTRLTQDSRWDSAGFCLSELSDAGWSGHGPGTFEAVFLDAGTRDPERVPPARWRHAHQDSLQTLLEWGWLGGSLWLILALALLVQSWRGLRARTKAVFSRGHATQAAAVTALTGLALNAQMDFPLQILGIQVTAVAIAALGAAGARKVFIQSHTEGSC